ncbi:MAG: VCBS repeat-containing protein [Verrucomicrobiales bacterium]|nr:VCBS repeat-containing protein [Verrucomicrobiales bacterium]
MAPTPVPWVHFTIDDPLPGTAWGTAGIPLADLDEDGDLDAALSRRDAPGFYWYERKSDAVWVRHVLSESEELPQGLGAAAADVNADGHVDLIFSGVWFENPGNLGHSPEATWKVHRYGGGGHDIVPADLNRDGRPDIVTFDGNILTWFDPAQAWSSNVVARAIGHHGGVAPRGIGDLDGDGDPDLVVAGIWFANPGNGRGDWQRHTWPHLEIPKASYGTSIRSWVADLDGDGQQDIIYGDCDTGSGHVYWARNEGKGEQWTRHLLPDPPTSAGSVAGTGSWHSLAVADFNGDGLLDVFGGEQEDPDTYMESGGKLPMKPRGLKERGVIWYQVGGPAPAFLPRVIHEDNPGWHDTSVGDVDGDGDPDLVSKIWNKDGTTYHADFWRDDRPPARPETH